MSLSIVKLSFEDIEFPTGFSMSLSPGPDCRPISQCGLQLLFIVVHSLLENELLFLYHYQSLFGLTQLSSIGV